MKNIMSILAISIALFSVGLFTLGSQPAPAAQASASVEGVRLRMSFEGGEIAVSLYDSQAARELVAMLPLTLSFEDFAGAEKIAHLPRKLSSGSPPSATSPGDFTYYAPWGNLAVFYQGYGSDGGLYILGKIESGKEKLARMNSDFTATIDVIDDGKAKQFQPYPVAGKNN